MPSAAGIVCRAGGKICGIAGLSVFLLVGGCAAPRSPVVSGPQPTLGMDRLVGATPVALEAEFGQPLLLRRDGPAQVWLYRSARCAVDLILYRDPASGTSKVAIADARPLGAPLSDAECLASLDTADSSAGRLAAGKF
jgi:hypothetical protein